MFESDEEYMDSLKQDDSYHFSIPFSYIQKKLGDDEYEDGTAIMEVDIEWDESQHGYTASHYVPDIYLIDPDEGNGDEQSFWEEPVYFQVKEKLESMGIPPEAFAFDTWS